MFGDELDFHFAEYFIVIDALVGPPVNQSIAPPHLRWGARFKWACLYIGMELWYVVKVRQGKKVNVHINEVLS